MDEFLDAADSAIVDECLNGTRSEGEFVRFWSFDKVQLDGDFNLERLKAIVKAMELMAARAR